MAWEHKIYMSDGRCLTGEEFEAELKSGRMTQADKHGYFFAKDMESSFKEKPVKNVLKIK